MSQKAFVVIGSTGYEGEHWTVAIYLDKDHAEKHAFEANSRAEEWQQETSHGYGKVPPGVNKWDDVMQMEAYSTHYEVHETTLFAHIDQYRDEKGL